MPQVSGVENSGGPADHALTPTTEAEWLVLAARLDGGRADEAAVVRVYWPAIADSFPACLSVQTALDYIRRHAAWLGRLAREAEEQALDR
jgi:hypothetical protein